MAASKFGFITQAIMGEEKFTSLNIQNLGF
jgi:hypothetical protein